MWKSGVVDHVIEVGVLSKKAALIVAHT